MEEKQPISDDEFVNIVLAEPESEWLDFKRVCNVNSILKTACAMANSNGGVIVLGVGDARQQQG